MYTHIQAELIDGKLRYKLKPGSIPTIFHSPTTTTTTTTTTTNRTTLSPTERQNKEKEKRQTLIKNAFEDYSRRKKLKEEEDEEMKKEKKMMDCYFNFKTTDKGLSRINIPDNPYAEYKAKQREMESKNFKDHRENVSLNQQRRSSNYNIANSTNSSTYQSVTSPTYENPASLPNLNAPVFGIPAGSPYFNIANYSTDYNAPPIPSYNAQLHGDVTGMTNHYGATIPTSDGNLAGSPYFNVASTTDYDVVAGSTYGNNVASPMNFNAPMFGNVAGPPIHYVACSTNFDLPLYNNPASSTYCNVTNTTNYEPTSTNYNVAGNKRRVQEQSLQYQQQQQQQQPRKVFVEMHPMSYSTFGDIVNEQDERNKENECRRRPVGIIFVESALANTSPHVTSNVTSNVSLNVTPNILKELTPNVTPNGTSNVTSEVTPNILTEQTLNVTSNVTSDVTSYVISNVTSLNASKVKHSSYYENHEEEIESYRRSRKSILEEALASQDFYL